MFQWPGMGLLFLKAVQNVDIPIMSAYLLLVAFIFVIINLIVDLLYVVVDPRIRVDGAAGADGMAETTAPPSDARRRAAALAAFLDSDIALFVPPLAK